MTKVRVLKNGTKVDETQTVNFIEGSGITLTVTENGVQSDIQVDGNGGGLKITRGGTLYSSSGITGAVNLIAWRAPYSCTLTKVYGYRKDGTTVTVNARRNAVDNHLSAALDVTSNTTWMDAGTVQNTAYVAGDILELMVVSVTALPTSLAWQVEFTRL